MPGAARFADICTGHDCYPSRPNCQASPDTYINNLGAHRLTDMWDIHCCGPDCHDGELETASPTVFVNNLGLGRCDDWVSCGSSVCTCSEDTIID